MVVISVYTYGVKIIKKFRWESGFLWEGSMDPPPPVLCTNGSAGYPMQLSVKTLICKFDQRLENLVSNCTKCSVGHEASLIKDLKTSCPTEHFVPCLIFTDIMRHDVHIVFQNVLMILR